MPNLPIPEGVTTPDLECVMLDVPPFDIEGVMGELYDEDRLYYGTTRELKYAQGAVGAEDAHVTLLFGIHPSITYERDVYEALDGWDLPDILINEVDYFPSRIEGEDYIAVIAHVVPSQGLLAGRRRLEQLPYTDAFPTYRPHITLAYLKGDKDDNEEWLLRLNAAFGHKFIVPTNLNLGLGD